MLSHFVHCNADLHSNLAFDLDYFGDFTTLLSLRLVQEFVIYLPICVFMAELAFYPFMKSTLLSDSLLCTLDQSAIKTHVPCVAGVAWFLYLSQKLISIFMAELAVYMLAKSTILLD